MNLKRILTGVGFSLLALIATGCGHRATAGLNLTYYPAFFDSDSSYSSIAIASVENVVEPGKYTQQLNSDLVKGYLDNNYYKVYNYTGSDMTDAELIEHLRQQGDVEMVLFTSVVNYGENRDERVETEYETETVYRVDENGNRVYDENGNAIVERTIQHAYNYKVYERNAYAAMSVRLMNVATGESIWSSTRKDNCYEEVRNPRKFSSPQNARWCSFDKITNDIVYQTSPTYKYVSYYADQLISIQKYDEGWEVDDEIPIDGQVRFVFWFPKEAENNTFEFDIVAAESKKVLVDEDMYFQGKKFVYTYNMADFVKASGEDKFIVRLWNRKKLATSLEFEVD